MLSRATGLGYTGLELLVRACPVLEAIDVSHCWGYGDREAAAVSWGTRLREVKMDKCLGVTDIGLAKIAVGCSRLERLSLKWCLEISDLGIDLLCKKCVELKFLDVSYLKVGFVSFPPLFNVCLLLSYEIMSRLGVIWKSL